MNYRIPDKKKKTRLIINDEKVEHKTEPENMDSLLPVS